MPGQFQAAPGNGPAPSEQGRYGQGQYPTEFGPEQNGTGYSPYHGSGQTPTQGYGQPLTAGQPPSYGGYQPPSPTQPPGGYGYPQAQGVGYGQGSPVPAGPPKPVRTAVTLMYAGAATSLLWLGNIPQMRRQVRDQSVDGSMSNTQGTSPETLANAVTGTMMVFIAIAVGLWVLHAVMNKKGKNWARISAAVLTVLGVISGLANIVNGGAMAALFSVLQIVIAVAATTLLFRPESNRYFQQRSAPTY